MVLCGDLFAGFGGPDRWGLGDVGWEIEDFMHGLGVFWEWGGWVMRLEVMEMVVG